LTLEEEKYYETYFTLFSQEGWKEFRAEIKSILDNYRIEDIKDQAHLSYVKGERNAFYKVLQFENGIRTAYDMIKEREAKSND
jgi:hypothetical protein